MQVGSLHSIRSFMPVQLLITWHNDTDGRVTVEGPLDNKLIAYGLLSIARDSVQGHNEANGKLIQPAPFVLPRNN